MGETDRRRQILEAALRVFAEHGYHKASIKQIAASAMLKSSALIYHYFTDKRAVLEAIVREISPISALLQLDHQPELLAQMMATPPRQLLPMMLERVLSVTDQPLLVAAVRLLAGETLRLPEVRQAVYGLQTRLLGLIVAYLDQQVAQGLLVPHNTQVSARLLMGSVVVYILGQQGFDAVAEGLPPRSEYIQTAVDLLLSGIEQRH
jgi:TetR/AcrR family transcriptional regulator, cholesterol catabolism regulator